MNVDVDNYEIQVFISVFFLKVCQCLPSFVVLCYCSVQPAWFDVHHHISYP